MRAYTYMHHLDAPRIGLDNVHVPLESPVSRHPLPTHVGAYEYKYTHIQMYMYTHICTFLFTHVNT